jgi:transposase InsO family protein
VSIRRACRVLEVDTSTYHYKSRRPEQAALEQRIRDICQTRVRYGYQRIHVLLRRETRRIDDVQNLSHNWVGLAAPNLADLEVAKRNQASRRAPPWQTIHRVR